MYFSYSVSGENKQPMRNYAAIVVNSLVVPEKVKHSVTIWSINPTPRYIPKELKTGTQTDTCMPMLIAALFTVTKM